MRILVIEDERKLAHYLQKGLRNTTTSSTFHWTGQTAGMPHWRTTTT